MKPIAQSPDLPWSAADNGGFPAVWRCTHPSHDSRRTAANIESPHANAAIESIYL